MIKGFDKAKLRKIAFLDNNDYVLDTFTIGKLPEKRESLIVANYERESGSLMMMCQATPEAMALVAGQLIEQLANLTNSNVIEIGANICSGLNIKKITHEELFEMLFDKDEPLD